MGLYVVYKQCGGNFNTGILKPINYNIFALNEIKNNLFHCPILFTIKCSI